MTRYQDIYPADRVVLREVGLRDGLQLVKKFPSTAETLPLDVMLPVAVTVPVVETFVLKVGLIFDPAIAAAAFTCVSVIVLLLMLSPP